MYQSWNDNNFFISAVCSKHSIEQTVSPCFSLANEHKLSLYVNGHLINTFICSPVQLKELCIGWLHSEGYLGRSENLLQLEFSEDKHSAFAVLLQNSRRELIPLEVKKSPDPSQVFSLYKMLKNSPVYRETHGVHECILSVGEDDIIQCTDISRYNAIDKAIGCALLRGVNFSTTVLFTSGRVSAQLVYKSIYCGIPIVASKAAATVQAVRIAQEYTLTLLFFVEEDHYAEYLPAD